MAGALSECTGELVGGFEQGVNGLLWGDGSLEN